MAAAGAGGGHAPPAYLLLGHSSLIDIKPTKIVPEGYTIVTWGKCGYETTSASAFGAYSYTRHGIYSLIDSTTETIDPLLLQNPETRGKSFLARKLGPVFIEKPGTSYIDVKFCPTNIVKLSDGTRFRILTAGIIKTPFTHDKLVVEEYDSDYPISKVPLKAFYENTVFPPFDIMESIIMRTVLHKNKIKYNLNDYDFLNTPIEELKATPLIVALYNCIYEKITISDFYHNYLDDLHRICNMSLSDLIRFYLKEPGVIYSLLCRLLPIAENDYPYISPDRNSNNSLLSVVNRQRKENLIKRQIEEAELGRKSFVKEKYNQDYAMRLKYYNRDIAGLQAALAYYQNKASSEKANENQRYYARHSNNTRKQIEQLQKEAAYFMPRKGGGKRRTQRRHRN